MFFHRFTWKSRHCHQFKIKLHTSDESFRFHTFKIFYNSVIWKDRQLITGKYHRQEKVKLFFSCIIRMFFSSFLSYFYGRRCSVMSVCNIDGRNFTKKAIDFLNLFLFIHDPYPMCNFIFRSKIIYRFMAVFPVFHQYKKFFRISAGKKDRACIGIADIHVMDSVLLFVFSCQLMLLNHAIHIIIDRADAHDSCLGFSLPDQFIQIIIRFFILYQRSLCLKTIQIFLCFLIDFCIIKISLRIQIHFRSVYMEERIGIFFSNFTRFLSAHYVIGKCCHFLCFSLSGSYCPKCLK